MEHKHLVLLDVVWWDDWAASEYSLSRSDSRSIKDAGSRMQTTQAWGSALGIDFVGFGDKEVIAVALPFWKKSGTPPGGLVRPIIRQWLYPFPTVSLNHCGGI
jgi:hypothetical protein